MDIIIWNISNKIINMIYIIDFVIRSFDKFL